MTRAEQIRGIIEDFQVVKQALVRCMSGSPARAMPNSQWLALSAIARLKTASTKDVSESLGVTSSAATQLVDELVRNGHAVRSVDKKDRRATAIVLTPKTQKLFKSLQGEHVKSMTKVFKALDDSELDRYAALHRKLARQASKNIQ